MSHFIGKRVCVALSGGRDSVALLHFLRANREKFAISLSAVTCEHGIRGESSRKDAQFVKTLCEEWQVPLTAVEFDTPSYAKEHKMGLEEAGRALRYSAFESILEGGEADVIATAHHRDDYAETVLFRLLRGTSLAGLEAFPERAGIARPLLRTTRAQIDAYVLSNGLPFREDESNRDTSYARNFLRQEAIPLLYSKFKNCTERLAQFAERAVEDDKYLTSLAEQAIEGSGVPLSLPNPVFSRACLILLKRLGVARDYTSANFEEIARLRALQSGRKITLPCGVECAREYDKVVFYHPQAEAFNEAALTKGVTRFGEYEITLGEGEGEGLFFDMESLPSGCVIRTRREGDKFCPYGGGSKSLKKFLTERKIPARIGKRLPLVALGDEILAVCGVEISEKIKVNLMTKKRGYIRTRPVDTNEE